VRGPRRSHRYSCLRCKKRTDKREGQVMGDECCPRTQSALFPMIMHRCAHSLRHIARLSTCGAVKPHRLVARTGHAYPRYDNHHMTCRADSMPNSKSTYMCGHYHDRFQELERSKTRERDPPKGVAPSIQLILLPSSTCMCVRIDSSSSISFSSCSEWNSDRISETARSTLAVRHAAAGRAGPSGARRATAAACSAVDKGWLLLEEFLCVGQYLSAASAAEGV
jgi:hypothetical protein